MIRRLSAPSSVSFGERLNASAASRSSGCTTSSHLRSSSGSWVAKPLIASHSRLASIRAPRSKHNAATGRWSSAPLVKSARTELAPQRDSIGPTANDCARGVVLTRTPCWRVAASPGSGATDDLFRW